MLLRGILGCRNLNCNGSSNDPNYANHAYNSQFIGSNQTAYNAGSKQLGTGKTYDRWVTDNIKENRVGTTVAGADFQFLVAIHSTILTLE